MLDTWSLWLAVLRAAILLMAARLLVRFVSLARWRSGLGETCGVGDLQSASPQSGPVAGRADLIRAAQMARCVEKAATRLPGVSRCLPRAVALQWMLRRERIASDLIIAIHNSDRAGEHAFHAWVEHAGQMVIGHCDRSAYSPVMILTQKPEGARAGQRGNGRGA